MSERHAETYPHAAFKTRFLSWVFQQVLWLWIKLDCVFERSRGVSTWPSMS